MKGDRKFLFFIMVSLFIMLNFSTLSLSTDNSKNTKIIKVSPINNARTDGTFTISYDAPDIENIVLNIKGSGETEYEQIFFLNCEEGKKTCKKRISLSKYNDQKINYFFTLSTPTQKINTPIYTARVKVNSLTSTINSLFQKESSDIVMANTKIKELQSGLGVDEAMIEVKKNKINLDLKKNKVRVEINGIENIDNIKNVEVLESTHATPIVAINPIKFDSALITLPKKGQIDAIQICEEWNFETNKCASEFKNSDLDFKDNGDTISFTVNHFSAYVGVFFPRLVNVGEKMTFVGYNKYNVSSPFRMFVCKDENCSLCFSNPEPLEPTTDTCYCYNNTFGPIRYCEYIAQQSDSTLSYVWYRFYPNNYSNGPTGYIEAGRPPYFEVNHAPTQQAPTLTPDPAYANTLLTCINGAVSDIDGDTYNIYYQFLVNDIIVQDFSLTNTFDCQGICHRGDKITCKQRSIDMNVLPNGTIKYFYDSAFDNETSIIIQNTAPVISQINDQYTNEDEPGRLNMLDYTTDIDNDQLNFFIVAENVNEVDCNVNGNNIDFTPAPNWFGTASCTVKANDGTDDSNEITFNIIVNPVNDAPIMNEIENQTTNEDTPGSVDVSSYASDVENDPLTFIILNENTNEVDCNVNGNNIDFTPAPNWFGTASCTIAANDGNSNSNPVTLNIIVTPVNDAPVLITEIPNQTWNEDTINNNIVLNEYFKDPDFDNLSYEYIEGSFVDNFNDGDFAGWTIRRSTFTNVDSTIKHNSTLHGIATINSIAQPNIEIYARAKSGTSQNSRNFGLVARYSSLTSYYECLYAEKADRIQIRKADGSASTTVLDFVNYALNTDQYYDIEMEVVEIAGIGPMITCYIDGNPAITYIDTDPTPLPGQLAGISSYGSESYFEHVFVEAPGINKIIESDSRVILTPAPEWSGTLYLAFIASDNQFDVDSNIIPMTVIAVNDAPIMNEIENQTTNEDTPGSVDVSSYASDVENDPLTFIILNENTNEVDCNVNGNNIDFTPAPNWFGTASCTIAANDGNSNSNPVTLNIIVTPVNDAPVLISQIPNQSWLEDSNTSIMLSNYFMDPDSDPVSYEYILGEWVDNFAGNNDVGWTQTSSSWNVVNGKYIHNLALSGRTVFNNFTGSNVIIGAKAMAKPGQANTNFGLMMRYTDNAHYYECFFGEGSNQIRIRKANGGAPTNINITSHVINADQWYNISGKIEDIAGGVNITCEIDGFKFSATDITSPLLNPGKVGLSSYNSYSLFDYAYGDLIPQAMNAISEDSKVTFTPIPNWNGMKKAAFVAHDSLGYTDSNTINLEVVQVNDAPIMTDIPNQTIMQGGSGSFDASLYAMDIENDTLAFEIVSEDTSRVDCNVSGNIVIMQAAANWWGIANCSIRANDGNLNSNIITFYINVTKLNHAPVLSQIPNQTLSEDTPTTLDITQYCSDIDNDPIFYQITAENTSQVDCNVSGTLLTLYPFKDWNGNASCSIICNDSVNVSNEITFGIKVLAINDAPQLNFSSINYISMPENSSLNLNLSVYTYDPDTPLNLINYTCVANNTKITISVNNTNKILTLNSKVNQIGLTNITCNATDDFGAKGTGWFIVNITKVNYPPILTTLIPNQSWPEDTVNTNIGLGNYYSDPNLDSLSYYGIQGMFVDNFQNNARPEWVASGAWSVIDGEYVHDANEIGISIINGYQMTDLNLSTFARDTNKYGSWNFGLVFGYLDNSNYYECTVRDGVNRVEIVKTLGGTPTTLNSTNMDIATNVTYLLEVTVDSDGAGSAIIRCFLNNSMVVSAIDTPYFGDMGLTGLISYYSYSVFDRVKLDELVPKINMSVNPTTGRVTLTPQTDWFGIRWAAFWACDAFVCTDSNLVLLNVTDATEKPLFNLSNLYNMTLEECNSTTINLSDFVDDVDTPDALINYTCRSGSSYVLAIADNITKILNITSLCGWSGATYISCNAIDDTGNSVWSSFRLIVTPKPTFNLTALEDTYINQQTSETNYGYFTQMLVESAPGKLKRSLLKFNITGVTSFSTAKLRLCRDTSPLITIPISAYSIDPLSWTEDTATWENSNAIIGQLLDTKLVTGGSSNVMECVPYEWNVAQAIIDAINNGETLVSFLIMGNESNGTNGSFIFKTSEHIAQDNRPRLIIN